MFFVLGFPFQAVSQRKRSESVLHCKHGGKVRGIPGIPSIDFCSPYKGSRQAFLYIWPANSNRIVNCNNPMIIRLQFGLNFEFTYRVSQHFHKVVCGEHTGRLKWSKTHSFLINNLFRTFSALFPHFFRTFSALFPHSFLINNFFWGARF
jgi:hypothetical protein